MIITPLLFAQSLISACPVGATLDADMSSATADDVITLTGVSNVIDCPEVSMTETWGGGKLIFSDSPESPTSNGALYKDETLPATSGSTYNRIFFYHVNNTGGTRRMAVLLKNTSGSSCTLTVQKSGVAGPTTSYLYAGKLGYNRWDTSSAGSGNSVAAGAWRDLDSTFSGQNVSNGNLYHGIWDYSFPCTHTVVTCIRNTSDSVSWCQTASVLSRDSHDRGTFGYADKVYDTNSDTILTSEELQQFPLASGTTNDSWATGYDNAVATPTAETLEGNYGVLYKMHLTTADDDVRDMGFCINPRAGAWGGAAFAMVGITPTSGNNHFLMPATTGSESSNTKCVVWGRYDIATSPSTTSVWTQWMPTGGSAFPVRLVTIPH